MKLDIEARSETVAPRLAWVARLKIDGLPAHLHRGQEVFGPGGPVHNGRLKRENEEKAGTR
jgi:hypothetical protein